MMHVGKIMCLVIGMSLMACRQTATQTSTAVVEPAQPIDKASVCPAQDFPRFLKAFMEDVALQKGFTRYPYKATVYDPQDLEANPDVQKMDADQMEFPVILSARAMADQGVKIKSEKKADDWYEVSTQSKGTGAYTMTFNFRYMQGCWFLTDSLDAST